MNKPSKSVHTRYIRVLDAPKYNSMMPSHLFGQSIRDLSVPQQQALNALLRTFQEHPRFKTPERYLEVTTHDLETLDTASSASQQHYIDTGRWLRKREAIEA